MKGGITFESVGTEVFFWTGMLSVRFSFSISASVVNLSYDMSCVAFEIAGLSQHWKSDGMHLLVSVASATR